MILNVSNSHTKWWLMAVSVVFGSISAWAINQHLHEKTVEIESRNRLDEMTLFVASRDLTRDTVIEESDFTLELFPVKWAPDGAMLPEQIDHLVGKRLLTDLRAGQPLMHVHLQDPDSPSVSSRLAPELKAVSVTVDPSSAAAGLIRAGDRVDLFVSLDHLGKRITVVLLSSVQVLGTGHLSDHSTRHDTAVASSEANITLAVSHADAVKLIAAREVGTISAVLSSTQNTAEDFNIKNTPADLASLLGLPDFPVNKGVPIMYGDRLSDDSSISLSTEREFEGDVLTRTVSAR